jgi:hypothetical protein
MIIKGRTNSIISDFWIQPPGQGACSFDEQELAVRVHHFDPDIRELFAKLSQDKDYQPFIFY